MSWKHCLALIGIVGCTAIDAANPPAEKPPLDRTKYRVERAVKDVVSAPRVFKGTLERIPVVFKELKKPVDVRKRNIELPTEKVLVDSGEFKLELQKGLEATLLKLKKPPRPVDVRKGSIEFQPKRLLAVDTAPAATPKKDGLPSIDFDNPKVVPGKVKWHSSFTDACAASRKSGKPVLLFQMMGNLDDQFC